MNPAVEVEIYRKHLERSLKCVAGARLFGKAAEGTVRDWKKYCQLTNNAELIEDI